MKTRMNPRVIDRLSLVSRMLGITTFIATGCGDDDQAMDDDGASTTGTSVETDASTTGIPEEITYWDHVAPLMYEHCATCHREGGVAPFNLTTYHDARIWATPSIAAMNARTMPPWLLTSDGSCGTFADASWLDDSVIDTISAWAAAGMPEGTPRNDLQVPPVPTLDGALTLSTPYFFPEIAGGDLAEFDEYRCFLLDPGLEADAFLTGYNVIPGNEAVVHHVLGMPVDPNHVLEDGRTNLEAMLAYDAESPDREGWPCFGAAGDDVEVQGVPVAWAPGQGIVDYPTGVGVRIGRDDLIVIQMHYNMADPATIGQSDQSDVQLRLEPSVTREAYSMLPDPLLDSLGSGTPHVLEPGQEALEYTWQLPVEYLMFGGTSSVDVIAVFPHMHEYGRKMTASVTRATGAECMADLPRWDFAWQLHYFYETPMRVSAGDVLNVTCTFDTRSATEPVLPGWGTRNEMCLFGLLLAP